MRLDAGRTIYCVPPNSLNQPLLRAPPSGVDASNVSGCGSKYVSVCSGVALELGAHVCGWRPQQQAYQSLRRADVVLPRETASHQRGVYLLHELLSGLIMCRAFENNMCRAVYNRFPACVQVVSAMCGSNTAALFDYTSRTTSASIQKAGRRKASIESPLIPTQPSSGPWDLVRGLVGTIYARLSCRGRAYMAV